MPDHSAKPRRPRRRHALLTAVALSAGQMMVGCGSQQDETEDVPPPGNPKGSVYDDGVNPPPPEPEGPTVPDDGTDTDDGDEDGEPDPQPVPEPRPPDPIPLPANPKGALFDRGLYGGSDDDSRA